ncbi:MAG: aspartate kinase [Christensenellaceae bacterium]
MIKVVKFGGSSVASSEMFKKIKNIVEADKSRKIVVVSALGKRVSSDAKITDLLYLLKAHIQYGVDPKEILDKIKERYYDVKNELGLKVDLDGEFDKIEADIKEDLNEEYIVSRGEYLCAKLMADYLGFEFVDAKDLFFFDYNGKIDQEKSDEAIKKLYKGKGIVVPGFYGAYPNGRIKLFSRGGSDISGSLLARGVGAELYENWTDVSGILMADPKIVENPKRIAEITYEELRELSYMGAKVLHEETVFPIEEMNIPIRILNTNRPQDEGTLITKNCSANDEIITGISGKKGFVSITVFLNRGSSKIDTIYSALKVFKNYKLNVEQISTSIDSFSLIGEKSEFEKCLFEVVNDIKTLDSVLKVKVDDDIALVAVVGRNMALKPGMSARIFSVFGKADINIKAIAQDTQELSIIVGISNKDFDKSIQAVYDKIAK